MQPLSTGTHFFTGTYSEGGRDHLEGHVEVHVGDAGVTQITLAAVVEHPMETARQLPQRGTLNAVNGAGEQWLFEDVVIEDMHISNTIRLSLGGGHVVSASQDVPDELPPGTEHRITWLLTSTPLLHDLLRKFWHWEGERLQEVDIERVLAKGRDGKNPLEWTVGDVRLSVFAKEEVVASPPDALGYTHRHTVFRPYATAVIVNASSSRAERELSVHNIETVLSAWLDCISFYSGVRTTWLAREESIRIPEGNIGLPRHCGSAWKRRLRVSIGALTAARPSFRSDVAALIKGAPSMVASYFVREIWLSSAISSVLLARQVPLVAEFLLLNTALETMKHAHLQASGSELLMPEATYSSVRSKLKHVAKPLLKAAGVEEDARSLFYKRMGDLNRPPYGWAVRSLCANLQLDLTEIYESSDELPFIELRDSYVHSGRVDDASKFATEARRLRKLVDWAISTVLGVPISPVRKPPQRPRSGGTIA